MSYARPIIPGTTYLITRRCSERRFFMRPDRATSEAYVYCLAVSAKKFKMDILAFGTMSNHHHIVLVDPKGRLPEFLQYFHRIFAAHQNVLRGRWESFWAASEQTSAVELIDDEAVLEKMVYALCNPVAAGLVDKVDHWPGPDALSAIVKNRPLRASRPPRFFRADGEMPEIATLQLVRPPGFRDSKTDAFAKLLMARVRDREDQLRAERIAKGRRVLGRKGVLAQPWNGRPDGDEPRRTLSPRVASRNRWGRMEALVRKKTWLAEYEDCRQRWLAGEADVVFPAGVWWLARRACVACEQADPPS